MTSLAGALGSRSDATVRLVLRVGWSAYWVVTAGMLLAGAAVAALVPGFLSSGPAELRELHMASTLLLLLYLLTPAALFRALAEARQRTYVVQFVLTATGLAFRNYGRSCC